MSIDTTTRDDITVTIDDDAPAVLRDAVLDSFAHAGFRVDGRDDDGSVDPAQRIHVPRVTDFKDHETGQVLEFIPSNELRAVADDLIERHERFGLLGDCEITYLWKAEGGATNGKRTLGKCAKPGGLVRYFSGAHFVIWLAADHARDLLLTQQQLEALVFHELCHAGISDKGVPYIVGHDWAGFGDEIREYGLYLEDVRRIDQVMHQLRLDGLADR